MRTGRPKTPVILTQEEKKILRSWSRLAGDTSEDLGFRARIILSAAKGTAGNEIATTLHTTQQTVCKWRKRFLAKRTEGLL